MKEMGGFFIPLLSVSGYSTKQFFFEFLFYRLDLGI